MTNEQLLLYHTDIKNMKGTVYEYFHKHQIKLFNRANRKYIEGLINERNEIIKKYFEIDENGQAKREGKEPILKEGLNVEDYKKEFADLMNKETDFKF